MIWKNYKSEETFENKYRRLKYEYGVLEHKYEELFNECEILKQKYKFLKKEKERISTELSWIEYPDRMGK